MNEALYVFSWKIYEALPERGIIALAAGAKDVRCPPLQNYEDYTTLVEEVKQAIIEDYDLDPEVEMVFEMISRVY